MRLTKVLQRTFFVTIILLLVGYILFNSQSFIIGPQILDVSPTSGSTLEMQRFTLSGKALRITEISLNDRPIFIDENGHFEEKLLVSPGLSIIKLHAKDRFGRETQQILKYVH